VIHNPRQSKLGKYGMLRQHQPTRNSILGGAVLCVLVCYVVYKLEMITSKVDGLEGKLNGLEGKLNNLEGKLNGFAGKLNGFAGKLSGLAGKMDTLAADVRTVLSKVSGLGSVEDVPLLEQHSVRVQVEPAGASGNKFACGCICSVNGNSVFLTAAHVLYDKTKSCTREVLSLELINGTNLTATHDVFIHRKFLSGKTSEEKWPYDVAFMVIDKVSNVGLEISRESMGYLMEIVGVFFRESGPVATKV